MHGETLADGLQELDVAWAGWVEQVVDEGALSAVHHRKVGTTY